MTKGQTHGCRTTDAERSLAKKSQTNKKANSDKCNETSNLMDAS